MAKKNKFKPAWFIAPGIILGIITLVLPIVQGFYYSLNRIRLFSLANQTFVGFQNYTRIFSDSIFLLSVRSTIVFTLGTTIGSAIIGLLIAAFLSGKNIRGTIRARVFMAFFLIPFVTTPVVVGVIGRLYVWESESGLFNYLLGLIGIQGTGWLTNPSTAMATTIATNIWRLAPLAILIFYAALSTIPEEIVESAEVDGAGTFTVFFRITLPTIRFHIGFVSLIILTSAFREFDTVFSLTGGGPGRITNVLSMMVYTMGVSTGDMGLANAISFTMFIIISVLAVLYIKVAKLDRLGE
ncbi:carbohydrate ABC transporter permease [Spirochaeta dissipatitropha]